MKKLNTTLDREPMNSQAIRERQDFNYVLEQTAAAKIPIWKSIWFYGPVGIAMVTMVVSAVRMNPKNENYEKNTTLSQTEIAITAGSAANSKNAKTIHAPIKSTIDAKETSNKVVEKQQNTTKSTFTVDNNTELKPEVLAQEKIEIEPKKKAVIVVPEVAKKEAKTMPDIAGIFNGRVSVSEMCGSGIINCNNGYKVISYEIQYDNGAGTTVDRVSGNEFPSHVCASLKRFNVGSPVFITRIIAMNEKGERKQLLSMSIEPTF